MKKLLKKFDIAIILLLTSITCSCVPAAIVSTGVVGTTIAGERTAGDRLDDNIIKLKINEAYIHANTSEMYSNIDVSVHEGRVLLTGSVKEQQYLDEASRIAWTINGVREVINEIQITNKSARDTAKDIFIANTVRSKLLIEKDLRSVNYIVEANNSVVYLLGVAQDQNELNRALKISGSVKGVQKVVNHVLLKQDSRRTKESQTQD